MPSSPAGQFVSIEVARGLLRKAGAPADWNLTAERFRCVLERSVAHRFTKAPAGAPTSSSVDATPSARSKAGSTAPSTSAHDPSSGENLSASSGANLNSRSSTAPDARAIYAYLDSLHAADLALACACGEGNAAAWDFFMAGYLPELYRGGGAIGGDWAGPGLADFLYAKFYGVGE